MTDPVPLLPVPDLDDLPAPLAERRAALRVFLRDTLLPAERSAGVRQEADAPADLRQWVRQHSAEQGLYRLLQPVDVGGEGWGPLGRVVLREEIGASGCVLGRDVLGGDGGLLRQATGSQRERLLLPVLRGDRAVALAVTDAREGPRTTAVWRGDRFRISGVKSFVTDGPTADLLLVVATVRTSKGAAAGPALFAVPRETPGLVLRRERRTLDGSVHGEFVLEDVAVPRADVVGEIGAGLPQVREGITTLRLDVAATACGAARWALGHTLGQVDRPHRSGTPLAEHEQVQAMLADSALDLYAARSALGAAARRAESGADATVEVALAKALATEAVGRVVDRAIQLTGGSAVVEEHPLARLYRRVRVWRIAEGTTEVLRLVAARGLLGRYRSGPARADDTPTRREP